MTRVEQPPASPMQLWLASVHLAGASVFTAFAVTNMIAALYHLQRLAPAEGDRNGETARHADAFVRGKEARR